MGCVVREQKHHWRMVSLNIIRERRMKEKWGEQREERGGSPVWMGKVGVRGSGWRVLEG